VGQLLALAVRGLLGAVGRRGLGVVPAVAVVVLVSLIVSLLT